MTFDQWIPTVNGKGLDYDGYYGNQCVDLIEYYLRDVFGSGPFYGNAIDWYNNFGGVLADRFNRVANNPNDYNQVPSRGDIIIWSAATPGSGGYGHIAIFLQQGAAGQFVSLDQNWGGMYVHQVTHNYNNVVGWLTPKGSQPAPQGDDEVITKDDAGLLRIGHSEIGGWDLTKTHNGDYDQLFLNAWQGHPVKEFIWAQWKAGEPYRAAKAAQDRAIKDLSAKINEQNQVITDIMTDKNATKAQLQEAIGKLADLNSQLATAHDKITDLEKQGPKVEYVHDEETKQNVSTILKVVNSIKGLVLNLFKRK